MNTSKYDVVTFCDADGKLTSYYIDTAFLFNNIKQNTMKPFIGVKMIMAQAMTAAQAYEAGANIPKHTVNEEPGYLVDYGTYQSWSPKDVFEAAYYQIEDETKISMSDVDGFRTLGEGVKLGDKTCVLLDSTITGFDMIGTSACVDPANYDPKIGEMIARKDITDALWGHLGFVLQWAKFGLKGKANASK